MPPEHPATIAHEAPVAFVVRNFAAGQGDEKLLRFRHILVVGDVLVAVRGGFLARVAQHVEPEIVDLDETPPQVEQGDAAPGTIEDGFQFGVAECDFFFQEFAGGDVVRNGDESFRMAVTVEDR